MKSQDFFFFVEKLYEKSGLKHHQIYCWDWGKYYTQKKRKKEVFNGYRVQNI